MKENTEETEIERHQIQFGEPYENTRKHSKFDVGEDLIGLGDIF
jgi:hypothetical protein